MSEPHDFSQLSLSPAMLQNLQRMRLGAFVSADPQGIGQAWGRGLGGWGGLNACMGEITLQLFACDQCLIGQQNHALDAIAQFPNVAGPRLQGQSVQRFGAEVDVFLVGLVGPVDKVQGQFADVFLSLGQ